MSTTAFTTASQWARLVRARKIGSLELLKFYETRVSLFNPPLNAVIATRWDEARREARAVDRAMAQGKALGPLAGVPMTVKESFDVAGLPTTWGFTEYAGKPVATDALAVRRFKAAGAVIFGKTNVPVALADWQSFNPVYGTTNNPWDVARGPGGSSGGSAAALAAGITALEIGSDIGASIRDPAHYCGVYGHKPTYGVCGMQGHALGGALSYADISVIGPLARSAADLKLALSVMAGPNDAQSSAWQLKLPRAPAKPLRDLRVAVMLTDKTAEVDQSVQRALQGVADWLKREKVTLSFTARPAFDTTEAHRTFIGLLRAATSGRLSPAQSAQWEKLAIERASSDFSYEAQAARGSTMRHANWLKLNETRLQYGLAWARFFEEWDVLICPAGATSAFPHMQTGERWERMLSVNGKPQPTTTQMFWAGYSGMCFLPSTVAPVGFCERGLPIGAQIIGPMYGDYRTIAIAQMIERGYHRFTAPPGY